MPENSMSQEGDTVGHDGDDRSGSTIPETARSVFDPTVRMANREMSLRTCRVLSAVIRGQTQQVPRRVIRADDL